MKIWDRLNDYASYISDRFDENFVRYDNSKYTAKIVGSDPATDLAVLKIEGKGFKAIPIGNSDAVWIEKMQNPLWRELYGEVKKKYSDLEFPQKK